MTVVKEQDEKPKTTARKRTYSKKKDTYHLNRLHGSRKDDRGKGIVPKPGSPVL